MQLKNALRQNQPDGDNLPFDLPTPKRGPIDVATGFSVFVEGSDVTLLYQGGNQDDVGDGADHRIAAYIRAVRPHLRRIDNLILSHLQKDDLEWLPDVSPRNKLAASGIPAY